VPETPFPDDCQVRRGPFRRLSVASSDIEVKTYDMTTSEMIAEVSCR